MYELIHSQFEQFAYVSGIIGLVRENMDSISKGMILLGILLCVFGIFIFRYVSAVITFFLVAGGIIVVGSGRASWGTVVTAFAVAGVFLAYYIWSMNYVPAMVFSLSPIALYLVNAKSVWETIGYIVLMIGCVFVVYGFPVESMCISSTVVGILLLKDLLVLDFPWIWIIVAALGIVLQLMLSKKQSLFDKRYPEWLTTRMKKKEN